MLAPWSGLMLLALTVNGLDRGWVRVNDKELLRIFDWCHLYSCPISKKMHWWYSHTMCVYSDELSLLCKNRTVRRLKEEERRFMTNLHNQLRHKVATGRERSNYTQPPAANMLQLVYNLESEMIAERWAKQCMIFHEKDYEWYDDCRDLMDGTSCNQLAGQSYVTSLKGAIPSNVIPALDDLINEFYKKITEFDHDRFVHNFTGHPELYLPYAYSQICTARTESVGCAVIEDYSDFNAENHHLPVYIYCNYCPPLIDHQMIYKVGTPCSECPQNTKCSLQYPGLCKQRDYLAGVKVEEELSSFADVTVISPSLSVILLLTVTIFLIALT